jgi:hypothetical protein
MAILVPLTDANYVQRRLKWDTPESDYSEQRKRELAEMDDAQREPLSGDHVIGRLLLQEPLANTARLLVERLQVAERELQAKDEELADLYAEAPTGRRSARRSPVVDRVEPILRALDPDQLLLPHETLLVIVGTKLKEKGSAPCGLTALKKALRRVRSRSR